MNRSVNMSRSSRSARSPPAGDMRYAVISSGDLDDQSIDGRDKDNALILRRLNRLSRRSARQERDMEILSEAFAAFVRLYLAYCPELPPKEVEAKRLVSEKLYGLFVENVSRRLSNNARLTSDVLKDDGKNDEDADTDISAAKQQSDGR